MNLRSDPRPGPKGNLLDAQATVDLHVATTYHWLYIVLELDLRSLTEPSVQTKAANTISSPQLEIEIVVFAAVA